MLMSQAIQIAQGVTTTKEFRGPMYPADATLKSLKREVGIKVTSLIANSEEEPLQEGRTYYQLPF